MARPAAHDNPDRGSASRPLRLVHSVDGGPPSGPERVQLYGGRIAVMLLIASETVMFAALLVTYEVLRAGQLHWPPADLPRLPIALTVINTGVLLVSGFCMWCAQRSIGRGEVSELGRWIAATALLGVTFLTIQGSEWWRLVRRGLTVSSGVYGETFFVLIGAHALHVVFAVLWLLYLWRATRHGAYSMRRHAGVATCAMYWYFVCVVWMVLFPAVYLL